VTRPDVARFDPFAGAPRLHGACRVGVRPGTELIHPLAATGARPLRFAVEGLPAGLAVDPEGILRGTAPSAPGTHRLRVEVANAAGSTDAWVELVVGEELALTPPMGWNSWNVYGSEVSAEVIVAVAEAMVATGMRDLGYQYVNIDDHWHAEGRAADGTPRANPATFPDGIAPVADRLHELGLKLGIYSDAAHLTCGRCYGGYGYEEIDARTYAAWGVDLLKYDYCFAPSARAAAESRYGAMGRALRATDRSIVLSVCEWGFRSPWEWAPGVGGSYWRTTPDIFDTFGWSPLGMRHIAWRNMRRADDAGPGRWNDPDMLLVGNRGRGQSTGRVRLPNQLPRPLRGRQVWRFRGLDDVQAQSHVTLWAMMAAPLLASHDLATTDPFDLALLTNPDVLAVDQDPLGVQGRRVRSPLGTWQLVKPLVDGGVAVSFTNVTRLRRRATARLADHGLAGPVEVVDAWTGEALGDRRVLEVDLPRHASAMFVCRPIPPAPG
jgi:alpha-galactosidase